ncbi:hypothetical protein PCIT_a0426 [Pseudoalteromonas citrea]|uniref:Uncharacterized protein n=1 Tax=Pseudoalteromonas citrea TaxID=43655 RepID=A0AAD4AKK9_9GAMM|nr:hypothetical protein PCIT_a0426 [Pseudoalteromonas citrea]
MFNEKPGSPGFCLFVIHTVRCLTLSILVMLVLTAGKSYDKKGVSTHN